MMRGSECLDTGVVQALCWGRSGFQPLGWPMSTVSMSQEGPLVSAWVVTTCRGPSTTDSGHGSSRLPPACHNRMKPAFLHGTPHVIC